MNIHTPAGLDAFVDQLTDGPPVILADMGAGAGQVTYDWFDKMYPIVAEAGIAFTSIGVITADPASVESVLAWASRLRDRTAYLIVENSITDHTDFRYWRESDQAMSVSADLFTRGDSHGFPSAVLENATRNHGVTLGDVAARLTRRRSCSESSLVMRAQSYRRRHVCRVRQGAGVALAMNDRDKPIDQDDPFDDDTDRSDRKLRSRPRCAPIFIESSAIAARCPRTTRCYGSYGRCSSWSSSW